MPRNRDEPREAAVTDQPALDESFGEGLGGDIIFRALSSSFRAQLETPAGPSDPPPPLG